MSFEPVWLEIILRIQVQLQIQCMNFQVFEVNQEEQEFYIRQEMFHRPMALQANITVLEAKGLKTDSEGTSRTWDLLK